MYLESHVNFKAEKNYIKKMSALGLGGIKKKMSEGGTPRYHLASLE